MDKATLNNLEQELKTKYPLGIPRQQIGKATGGLLHPRTLANLDCANKGITDRYKFGRRTIYPVPSTIQFLRDKILGAA